MRLQEIAFVLPSVLAHASCSELPPDTCEREVHQLNSADEQSAAGFSLADVLAAHSEFAAELQWQNVPEYGFAIDPPQTSLAARLRYENAPIETV